MSRSHDQRPVLPDDWEVGLKVGVGGVELHQLRRRELLGLAQRLELDGVGCLGHVPDQSEAIIRVT